MCAMGGETPFDADVLIVGAGPVGLCAAVALGQDGHRVILIEKDGTRGPQPRAKTLNLRSLSHLRRWGLADKVRAASPTQDDLPPDIVFQTRLYGHHIATLPNIHFRNSTEADDPRFNEPSEWMPQYRVEDVLRERIQTLENVDLRYGTELVSFDQNADAVESVLLTDGKEASVCARYMIGADGGASRVREGIGGRLEGRYAYDCNFNLVLRIPELNETPPAHRGIMHWLINDDAPGIMGPIGNLWYIAKKLPRDQSDMSDEAISTYLEGIIGKKVAFEVMARDPWYAHELISDTYSVGRVFLAGDACQLRPPFGGFGMNTGIGDASDIAWKIGAVLKGWAGQGLLESYAYERRQVHQWIIDEAVANYAVLSQDLIRTDLEADTEAGQVARDALGAEAIARKRSEFHTIGILLGSHYGGSPVVIGGEDLSPPVAEIYDPVAAPGKLVPHYWVAPDVSIYDEFGSGLTLLANGSSPVDEEPFIRAAEVASIPLKTIRVPGEQAGLFPTMLTLARPDQHIAWMGDATTETDAEKILMTVTGR